MPRLVCLGEKAEPARKRAMVTLAWSCATSRVVVVVVAASGTWMRCFSLRAGRRRCGSRCHGEAELGRLGLSEHRLHGFRASAATELLRSSSASVPRAPSDPPPPRSPLLPLPPSSSAVLLVALAAVSSCESHCAHCRTARASSTGATPRPSDEEVDAAAAAAAADDDDDDDDAAAAAAATVAAASCHP